MIRRLLLSAALALALLLSGCDDDPVLNTERDTLSDPIADIAALGGYLFTTNEDWSGHAGSQVDLFKFSVDGFPEGRFDLGLNGVGYLAATADRVRHLPAGPRHRPALQGHPRRRNRLDPRRHLRRQPAPGLRPRLPRRSRLVRHALPRARHRQLHRPPPRPRLRRRLRPAPRPRLRHLRPRHRRPRHRLARRLAVGPRPQRGRRRGGPGLRRRRWRHPLHHVVGFDRLRPRSRGRRPAGRLPRPPLRAPPARWALGGPDAPSGGCGGSNKCAGRAASTAVPEPFLTAIATRAKSAQAARHRPRPRSPS